MDEPDTDLQSDQPPALPDESDEPVMPIEDLEVPMSAIEHYSYCPRQCGLIHLEQSFQDNIFTLRGRLAHQRVDSGDPTPLRGVKVARAMPLWSKRYGLRGKADLVELRLEGPYPVDYKVGRRHGKHPDYQLCAQALCLEEMLDQPVPKGAIYHVATRARREVFFDEGLRQRTIELIEQVRAMLRSERLPPALNDERCRNCSLGDVCLPSVVAEPNRLRGLQGALFQPLETSTGDEETGLDED